MDTHYDLQAKEMSFWTLIDSNFVMIPDIQRDYAQGRDDDEIARIRGGLIRDVIKAINDESVLNLNFIYGRLSNEEFTPIDGQQRLTTLFLFHWYTAKQSKNFSSVYNKLKKFSYSTRDTSRRFCEYLCIPNMDTAEEYDFSEEKISPQIIDKPWFTGAFEHDPTIVSMLTVLDSIHSELRNKNDVIKNIYDNFTSPQDNCFVRFLLLPLNDYNEKATEDLYIKMNSRGKLLTDFEIFKGRLQDSATMYKYAESILPSDECTKSEKVNEKIIELISLINNEYSELFFKFADMFKEDIRLEIKGNAEGDADPLIIFDKLLMKFFNEFCRYEYFLNMSDTASLTSDTQRTKIIGFSKLSVSDLWDAIGDNSEVISKAFALLKTINDNYDEYIVKVQNHGRLNLKKYFDNKILLNIFKSNYQINTLRYLSYCYLIKRGAFDDNFVYFKRIISNIVENGGSYFSKNPDASFRLAHFISRKFCFDSDIHLEVSNLDAPPFCRIPDVDQQIEEEKEKSKLILSSDVWKNALWEAEKYYADGQIDFLLKLCKKDGNHDLGEFTTFFALSKMLFDGSKCIQRSLDDILFRKALLYMEDKTADKMAYLLPSNTSKDSCWSFIKNDFRELLRGSTNNGISEKRELLFALIRKLKGFNPKDTNDVNIALKSIVSKNTRTFTGDEEWKNLFLDDNNGLFYSPWWKDSEKCIHKMKNGTVLLLTKLKTSSYNWDIRTYIVAKKRNEVDNLNKVWGKDLKTKEERFNRFLSSGVYRITYDYSNKNYYVSKNNGDWEKIEFDEILALN